MLLEAREIWKTYRASEGAEISALRGTSLTLAPGERVALVGPSGCGKSTLLHCLAGLDRPDQGSVSFLGQDLAKLADEPLTRLRRDSIGFIFQFFNLLPTLTVRENVLLPCLLRGDSESAVRPRATALLESVGLGGREDSRISELSGGQQQRVAIARALVIEPRLILGDEPTGNLDSENGERVMDLLFRCARESGCALVLATHSAELAARADRVLRMQDGRMAE